MIIAKADRRGRAALAVPLRLCQQPAHSNCSEPHVALLEMGGRTHPVDEVGETSGGTGQSAAKANSMSNLQALGRAGWLHSGADH